MRPLGGARGAAAGVGLAVVAAVVGWSVLAAGDPRPAPSPGPLRSRGAARVAAPPAPAPAPAAPDTGAPDEVALDEAAPDEVAPDEAAPDDVAALTSEGGPCVACALAPPRGKRPRPARRPSPSPSACSVVERVTPTTWLYAHLAPDGRLDGQPEGCDCCAGHARPDPALDDERVALALLACASTGSSHRVGPDRPLARALLRRLQERLDLVLTGPGRAPALCAWALADLFAVTRDPRLLDPARRAVEVAGQGLVGPAGDDPLARAGVALGARALAAVAVAAPPPPPAPAGWAVTLDPARRAAFVLTALARGEREAAARAVEGLPVPDVTWRPGVDLDAALLVAHALAGRGEAVDAWRRRVDAAVGRSCQGGCAEGSLDPIDARGRDGGRARTTAVGALLFEMAVARPARARQWARDR